MVGPKYEPPDLTVMPEWKELDDPQLSGEPLADPKWWSSAFNDPALDRLSVTSMTTLTMKSHVWS